MKELIYGQLYFSTTNTHKQYTDHTKLQTLYNLKKILTYLSIKSNLLTFYRNNFYFQILKCQSTSEKQKSKYKNSPQYKIYHKLNYLNTSQILNFEMSNTVVILNNI